ncbi:integrase core domain protein [Bordetella pertussis STO1-SEAT-0004]|nr:integrase core domain-containing protein [Bordetella pertussis]ETI04761.1 integrase core domain protein [Bordetella pertussis STO1-SEAT-0004]
MYAWFIRTGFEKLEIARADAMKSWLHHYNWHRPHQGIGRAVPISRLNLDEYNLLTVHR